MIIDVILDRMDGVPYDREEFIRYLKSSVVAVEDARAISAALERKDGEAARLALCDYVKNQGYHPSVCDYVYEKEWV